MAKHPARMWKYWRDKKGLEVALSHYYKDRLSHPRLANAIQKIKDAEAEIEAFFAEEVIREEND